MRRDTINYLTVGIFVLVLLFVLLVVLYKITGRSGPTDDYFVTYQNVEGIKYGTPVLYEGYQIGQVESVDPVREAGGTTFKLDLGVQKGWLIPSDSIAKVVKSGLLSSVAIDIQEGKSTTPLEPGHSIAGREAADIFAAVNDVATDLRSLSRDSLRPLLNNVNTQVTEVSGDIKSLTRNSIRPLLDKQGKDLLTKLNTSADRLLEILSPENQKSINNTLSNLDKASENVGDLLTRLEETRTMVNQLLTKVDGVVDSNQTDVRQSMKDLRKTLYAISQHIDALTDHMEGSARNLHEFTRQVRENPGLLLHSSPQPATGEKQ